MPDPSIVDPEFRATALGWAENAGDDDVAKYLAHLAASAS